MFATTKNIAPFTGQVLRRSLATHAKPTKKEGDISSVFVSLSGQAASKLPDRFADIKRNLVKGHEAALTEGWKRLLDKLVVENEVVAQKGPAIVPQIDFEALRDAKAGDEFVEEVKKRGVAVVRGVVPEEEARGYKFEVEEYVKANPWTKGTFFILFESARIY